LDGHEHEVGDRGATWVPMRSRITLTRQHASQCRALTLVVLDRLVERAAQLSDDAENGWLELERDVSNSTG